MTTKLTKNTYPDNHIAEDFQCFGPPAIEDGNFENVKIADLGCFTQEGKDSNKYYHAAIVQSKKDQKWYVYFEWGRTGNKSCTFQFVSCNSEIEAMKEFAKQLHSKNDKRGEWVTIAGIKTLKSKGKDDCYLVRPQATRSTGLPNAKTIKLIESSSSSSCSTINSRRTIDSITFNLLKDLNVGTISYTRGSMADTSLPTQKSIDEARDILNAVQKRVAKIGDNINDQILDKEIIQLTNLIYSRIPKKKQIKSTPESWLLTKDNILSWQSDLDAFESALSSDVDDMNQDPYNGMPFSMEYINPNTSIGKFLYNWWPKATGNRHSYLGNMKIKNIWSIERKSDQERFHNNVKKISNELKSKRIPEKPLYQPKERSDINKNNNDLFHNANVALLFHGTRSVNVKGILSTGLRNPKELVGVVITGAMFGPLIYFADDWKKSAGYTSLSGSYWSSGSGAINKRGAFMFAANVTLGNPHIASSPYGYTSAPKGNHSILGKAGYSGVQNNEWVIPTVEQIELKYLLEFTT